MNGPSRFACSLGGFFGAAALSLFAACRTPSSASADAAVDASSSIDAGTEGDAGPTDAGASEAPDAAVGIDAASAVDAAFDASSEGGSTRGARYLILCDYVGWFAGYSYVGYAIDSRGIVYRFDGGKKIAGTSEREIAALVRAHGTKSGALSADEIATLVELAPAVAEEPFSKHAVRGADRPGGGCALLSAGATPDALTRIELEESANTQVGKRVGPASAKVQKIVAHADRIVEAR